MHSKGSVHSRAILKQKKKKSKALVS